MSGFDDPPDLSVGKSSWIRLVRIVALVPVAYLVIYSSFLAFLALVFSSSADGDVLDRSLSVVQYSTPMCCYAAIGALGIKLVGTRRFWALGVSAILVETWLALYALAHPGSIPLFTGWLL